MRPTPMPSAIVSGRSRRNPRPVSRAVGRLAAPSAWTPNTFTLGRRAFTAIAIPAARPPPPTGTRTVRASGTSPAISSPAVPFPAIIKGCANGGRYVSGQARQASSSWTRTSSARGTGTTSAPSAWIAASFCGAAPSGTRTTHRSPRRRADHATARPWFPELRVVTPRRRSSSVRREMRFQAPRILNTPSRCRFSSFRRTCPSRPSKGRMGVWRATSRTTGTARSTSRIVTSIRSTALPRSRDSERPHLREERLPQALLERSVTQSELPRRLRVAPQVRRARADSEHLRPRDRGEETEAPGGGPEVRRGNPRDSLRHLDRIDERARLPRDDVALAGSSAPHRQEVARGGVLDMAPAVRGDLRHAAEFPLKVLPEGDAHRARVPRPVRDPGLHDDEREPLPHHGLRNLVVGGPLRAVVLAQPRSVVAVRLVHDLPVRVPEDREGARVHTLRDPELVHETEDVPRAVDVAPDRRGLVLLTHLVPRREVEHAVRPCHGGPHRLPVCDVPLVKPYADADEVPRLPRIPRDRVDLVPRLPELANESRADETRGARHEVSHGPSGDGPPRNKGSPIVAGPTEGFSAVGPSPPR